MPRQTFTFLKSRFDAAGIRPQSRHGQNFLIDLNLLDVLVDAAAIEPCDVVLEVGTGAGSLTALLAARAAAVVTVEIDAALQQLAREELADATNVLFLHQDVLKNKNRIHANVLAAVQERLDFAPERRFKLAANLPFNVATPLISNLLAVDSPPASMTVTIQKEMADRLLARPSTKDYGALSIWVQSQCDVQLVRTLPPTAFWPRPLVTSAIVHITLDPARRAKIVDRAYFHSFVRSMFFHRRKFIRSQLASACKDRLNKQDVDDILRRLGLKESMRAEELSVDRMQELCDATRQQSASSPAAPEA